MVPGLKYKSIVFMIKEKPIENKYFFLLTKENAKPITSKNVNC